jgi:pSer/pThr/pTyr-binding forkhead associated (FHA) protein
MNFEPNGELVPVGGGDAIPLVRPVLTIGRRGSCDICLVFPNISGTHCELAYSEGVWVITDLNSTNGIKVNGARVKKKVLRPDDTLTIGKRQFTIRYALEIGRQALAELLDESEDLMDQPLLEKAGLVRLPKSVDKPRRIRIDDE